MMRSGRMSKRDLARCLQREVDRWSGKSFASLQQELKGPLAYRTTLEGREYQAEVQVLEADEERMHVLVSVDDLSLVRAIKPLNTSFFVYRDGGVDK
jgi:hypothetical protein